MKEIPQENLVSHYMVDDETVIENRKGHVVAWLNSAQPKYHLVNVNELPVIKRWYRKLFAFLKRWNKVQ